VDRHLGAGSAGEGLGARILPDSPRHRGVQQLTQALERLSPDAPPAERIAQLELLMRWIRSGANLPEGSPRVRPEVLRVRLLVRALEAEPRWSLCLAGVLRRTLGECSGLQLLTQLGLPGDRGFFGETVDRLSRRLLPQPVDESSLTQLMSRLFPKARDRVWLRALPQADLEALGAALVRVEPGVWAPLARATQDAVALLALRVSAVGLSEVIRARSPSGLLQASPFYRLPRACDAFLDAEQLARVHAGPNAGREADAAADSAAARTQAAAVRTLVSECRAVTRSVFDTLEERGVSVDVVYRLELIIQNLSRLERLVDELEGAAVGSAYSGTAVGGRDLLLELLAARSLDRSLSHIFRDNLRLMARKIIERAGHTGEHYITSSRREYATMLLSAGGGGLLTAGTTALKYAIAKLPLPLFLEGLLAGANYAGSFLIMQGLGFTLATKQPSMTAAALAGSLRQSAGHPDLSGLVAMIARITRSQLAAALGNIGMVIPAALAVDYWYQASYGTHFLSGETAAYVLHSLHPTHSNTVFYAALTGVLLWISSIFAGWVENWATYRRLPEAIADHALGRYVSRPVMAFLSRVFARNVAGFGGNTSLGFLLGMTPVMGKFFGLPLDVRHVTLSTGALTLALASLGLGELGWSEALPAIIGVAIIGCLNFGVSFVLALTVALRAREVERSDRWRLLVALVVTFVRSPFQFVFPPKGGAAHVHGPASIAPPAR
jgi:site-specific recombinase